MDNDGYLINDAHVKQIAAREAIQQQRMQAQLLEERITVARANDVVLGRGKSFQNHPGNQRLAKIVEEWNAEYQRANKQTKTTISKEIVGYVKNEMGGRFLQKDEENPEYWRIAADQEGRLKVAHAFRAPKQLASKSASGQADTNTFGDRNHDLGGIEVDPFETIYMDAEDIGGQYAKRTRY